VTARADRAKPCYDQALAADPALHGRVRVVVRIEENGSVCESRVVASDMPADMSQCIAHVLGGSSYPPPSGGCIDVEIPLSFAPLAADAGSP
jgi:hypothetical protein